MKRKGLALRNSGADDFGHFYHDKDDGREAQADQKVLQIQRRGVKDTLEEGNVYYRQLQQERE